MKNPDKYPDPENFRPERYLESSWPTYREPLTQYPNVKGMSSFGYGQRQCLGQSLTQDELVMACGGLLWGFDMKKKLNPISGKEIEIDIEKSNSLLIVKPDPFQMAFHPRSPARKSDMIVQWDHAEEKDDEARSTFLKAAQSLRDARGTAVVA